ncbi:MAG: proline--tRNA ligase, partial [Deltaproteobacteria bacterium]
MQDGKALQAGTSHDLGQNFGRAFDVKFQNREGKTDYVWQTSWGSSTRLIGGLIMTHSDDNGLVLPPRLAPVQVAIVPILGRGGDDAKVLEAGDILAHELRREQIAVEFDKRDYKPGYKYFEWEQKGVPLRLEIGPKDLEKHSVMAKDRLALAKEPWPRSEAVARTKQTLERLQQALLQRARKARADNTVEVDDYATFREIFADNHSKFVMAHWDGTPQTEAKIKEETRATIRCIPYDSPNERGKCIISGNDSFRRVLFAKAY